LKKRKRKRLTIGSKQMMKRSQIRLRKIPKQLPLITKKIMF